MEDQINGSNVIQIKSRIITLEKAGPLAGYKYKFGKKKVGQISIHGEINYPSLSFDTNSL